MRAARCPSGVHGACGTVPFAVAFARATRLVSAALCWTMPLGPYFLLHVENMAPLW